MDPARALPSVASRTRRVAIGLAVCLLVVAAVQVSDPAVGGGESVPASLDGPAEGLATAMVRSERRSHVQHEVRQSWNERADRWGTPNDDYARLKVEPDDRELLATGFRQRPVGDGPRWTNYVTEDGAWYDLSESGAWRLQRRWTTYDDVLVFDPSALADATVRRRARANGTVRYDVTGGAGAIGTAVGEPVSAVGDPQVSVWVDADRRVVERVRVVRSPGTEEAPARRILVDYDAYGETSVARPAGVPRFSLRLLVRDLLDGPLWSPALVVP